MPVLWLQRGYLSGWIGCNLTGSIAIGWIGRNLAGTVTTWLDRLLQWAGRGVGLNRASCGVGLNRAWV
jgi:hypothetical protein